MTKMESKRKGIAVAGNMIVDKLYPVSKYPNIGELSTIVGEVSSSTGGAVCNVIEDIAKLDSTVPLTALGRIGDDPDGKLILNGMSSYSSIDISSIHIEGKTSYTLVMSEQSTKQRTFFQYRGANAAFCQEDIDFKKLNADILHIGYILLLDTLDEPNSEYGTNMAKLLHAAQKQGTATSIDIVSESGSRFRKIVPPALKYTDYCIINEFEAQETTGVTLRSEDGGLVYHNIPSALKIIKELGVSTWAVIHCPEGGFGLDEKGNFFESPSVPLSKADIAGTVGAGDAFCAGVLYAAWCKMPLEDAIKLGNGVAACSLTKAGATEGVRSLKEVLAFCDKFTLK